jgi:hypothetical protein
VNRSVRSSRTEDEEGSDVQTPASTDVPGTGDVEVDTALTRLADRIRGELTEHVPAYEAVHRELQDRLADAEE